MKGRGSLRAASATASLPGQVLARRLFARAAASKAKQEWSSPLSRCYIRVPQRDGRPARPCQATAACTRRGARIAGLHSSSRETNVRGERARQRRGAAAAGANHRVWRAGSASTGNGQRSPRDRSKEEPTNWAVKGARNAPAPVGRVVRRKDSLFSKGGRRKARDRASAVHDGQRRIYGYHARSLRLVRLPATARGRRGHDCFYSGRRGMPAFRLER